MNPGLACCEVEILTTLSHSSLGVLMYLAFWCYFLFSSHFIIMEFTTFTKLWSKYFNPLLLKQKYCNICFSIQSRKYKSLYSIITLKLLSKFTICTATRWDKNSSLWWASGINSTSAHTATCCSGIGLKIAQNTWLSFTLL